MDILNHGWATQSVLMPDHWDISSLGNITETMMWFISYNVSIKLQNGVFLITTIKCLAKISSSKRTHEHISGSSNKHEEYDDN